MAAGRTLLDSNTLAWSVFLGAFGFSYFIYGKKQGRMVPLICGVGLMVVPYFLTSNLLLGIVGIGLIVAPFVYHP